MSAVTTSSRHNRRSAFVGCRGESGSALRRRLPGRPACPHVHIGGLPARATRVSASGQSRSSCRRASRAATAVRLDGAPGETAYIDVATPLATGLHLVDSPVFDRNGNLYVTFSGSRGQQAPISLFVVRPDGTREPFAGEVPNPTSMAFDNQGMLYVSSRFDGSVHRITPDGNVSTYATDLGVACGIAFGRTMRCMSGTGRDRSCVSMADAPGRRGDHPGQRRGTPPRIRARRLALRDRSHARRTIRYIASPLTARCRSSRKASGGHRDSRSTIRGVVCGRRRRRMERRLPDSDGSSPEPPKQVIAAAI